MGKKVGAVVPGVGAGVGAGVVGAGVGPGDTFDSMGSVLNRLEDTSESDRTRRRLRSMVAMMEGLCGKL